MALTQFHNCYVHFSSCKKCLSLPQLLGKDRSCLFSGPVNSNSQLSSTLAPSLSRNDKTLKYAILLLMRQRHIAQACAVYLEGKPVSGWRSWHGPKHEPGWHPCLQFMDPVCWLGMGATHFQVGEKQRVCVCVCERGSTCLTLLTVSKASLHRWLPAELTMCNQQPGDKHLKLKGDEKRRTQSAFAGTLLQLHLQEVPVLRFFCVGIVTRQKALRPG